MKLFGNIVALVTPMTNSGDICYDALNKLIDFHLDNDTNGLVVLGTTGEAATIFESEQQEIVTKVLKRVDGKIPVIVGSGNNCTDNTIKQTQLVKTWGADAALIVTPYYNKPTQEGLYQHYKAIVNNTDIPIVLYNVPGRTGVDMQPETTAKLAHEFSQIIGLKDAVPGKERINKLVNQCPNSFALLSGDDETFVDFMKCGGTGVVSVTSNLVPKEISRICSLISQDIASAEAININSKLEVLYKNMFICSNPIPVKWALYQMGLISSPMCRLPLVPLEQVHHDKVLLALQQVGLNAISKAV